MHRRSVIGVRCAVALFACGAGAAWSQSEEALLLGELNLDDAFALLQEEDVVVSATTHAQRIEASPSAITVITREQILMSGYRTLPELLRLVPGADVFYVNPAQHAVGIRSNSTMAGDLILVLVDGRDALQASIGQTLWQFLPFDVESIERIEVIRGPGSSIYGANALQGVINIVTRRATDRPLAGEVTASAASAATFQVDGRTHGKAGPVTWWLSGGIERQAAYDDPTTSDMESWRVRAWVASELGDAGRASLELGVSRGESGVTTALGSGRWSLTWPYATLRLEYGRTQVDLTVEADLFSADLDAGLVLPLGDADVLRLADVPELDHRGLASQLDIKHHLTLRDLVGGERPKRGRSFLDDNRLTFGAVGKVVRHRADNIKTCPDSDDYQTFDSRDCTNLDLDELRAGVFLQDEWQILDSLAITLGARLDWNTIHPDVGISPRAAVVWSPALNHAVRASAGSAYRKPTLLEAFFHTQPVTADLDPDDELFYFLEWLFGTQVGNADLTYERAVSYELGWRGSFLDGRLTANVEAFYVRHIDEIRLTTSFDIVSLVNSSVAFENQPVVRETLGGEIEVRGTPFEWFDLRAAYGLDFHIEEMLERDTLLEPTHRIITSARVRLPVGLHAGADVLWSSPFEDRVNDPISILEPAIPVPLGDIWFVNGSVGYRMALGEGRDVDVVASVFNLLDRGGHEVAGVEVCPGENGARERVCPTDRTGIDPEQIRTHGGRPLGRRVTLIVRGRF